MADKIKEGLQKELIAVALFGLVIVVLVAQLMGWKWRRPAVSAPGSVLLRHEVGPTLEPALEARLAGATHAERSATLGLGEGKPFAEIAVRFTTAVDPATGDGYVQKIDAIVGKNEDCEIALRANATTKAPPIHGSDGHKAWPVELVASYDCGAMLRSEKAGAASFWIYGDGSKRDYGP